ncbi:MAG: undecaprenyl-diphosphate phosphatase [Clostridia bacterium]|nr:undecaprenyl-diphosphate phosphatase [Clostridia bacterium]
MRFLTYIYSAIIGIVEGITEWLPISSTGHMILFDELLHFEELTSPDFYNFFEVAVQLGAILAVVILYFKRLNPFSPKKTPEEKKATWQTWLMVLIGILPATLIGVPFDDWFDEHLHNFPVVGLALIVYGVAFIIIERVEKNKEPKVSSVSAFTWKTALLIGLFQVLSLIPGTSRSGSTILGAMLLGVSRTAAAEYSFFMAIPVMAGACLIRGYKFFSSGVAMTAGEIGVLAVGIITAFVVSYIAIKFLMDFVKKHSFEAFGWYRIVLGIIVIIVAIATGKAIIF